MKHILFVNVDEVGDNIPEVVSFLSRNNIKHLELRTIDGKNIANFNSGDLQVIQKQVVKYGFHISALASPLFKWYLRQTDIIQSYDSFNFPCILSESEKREAIDRVINNARVLNCPKVRVFTGLSGGNPSVEEIIADESFKYCLTQGKKKGIGILVENEPVCNVHTFNHLKNLLSRFENLNLWLDVANLYQLDEKISLHDLEALLPRVRHVHLKDFIIKEDQIQYVPLGDGDIPWREILYFLFKKSNEEISFSIETHMPKAKVAATQKSVNFYRTIEKSLYEHTN